ANSRFGDRYNPRRRKNLAEAATGESGFQVIPGPSAELDWWRRLVLPLLCSNRLREAFLKTYGRVPLDWDCRAGSSRCSQSLAAIRRRVVAGLARGSPCGREPARSSTLRRKLPYQRRVS